MAFLRLRSLSVPRCLTLLLVAAAGVTGVLGAAGRVSEAPEASPRTPSSRLSTLNPRLSTSVAPVSTPAIVLEPLASGLPGLTSIVSAGGVDSRLFLTEQLGRVVIWNGARVQAGSFLDVSGLVSCCGEQGLLSMAFHPQYASNGLFFVTYTNKAGNTVIARYRVSSNPDVADAASGVVLLTIAQPFANHNGGQLQFGPDGYLYIGMGDGGSANDPMCNAQRDDVLLGKLLRIDVDVSAAPYYTVPPDNPFKPGGVPNEVWSKGLRNPWRFSFDRATGDLWIADVGQGAREEVDFAPRGSGGGSGQNYGWKVMEGTICGGGGLAGCPTSPAPPACGSAAYTAPVYEYDHSAGDCSITGGYVYRGSAMPSFAGQYFYGDYCTGKIWANGQLSTPRAVNLTTFGQDANGELYLATGNGALFRLAQSGAPPATPTPVPPTPTPAFTPTEIPERALVPAPVRRPSPRPVTRG